MVPVDEYEEKLHRPGIGPTTGCLVYFGTVTVVCVIMCVAVYGLILGLWP